MPITHIYNTLKSFFDGVSADAHTVRNKGEKLVRESKLTPNGKLPQYVQNQHNALCHQALAYENVIRTSQSGFLRVGDHHVIALADVDEALKLLSNLTLIEQAEDTPAQWVARASRILSAHKVQGY